MWWPLQTIAYGFGRRPYMPRMFSFSCLPGLNRGINTSGRVMRSFVAGLMPEREGRFETQYAPKPVIDTLLPALSSFSMMLVTAERTRAMSFLLNAVSSLTFVINSLLFIVTFPGIKRLKVTHLRGKCIVRTLLCQEKQKSTRLLNCLF